jgi:hypothetical protein
MYKVSACFLEKTLLILTTVRKAASLSIQAFHLSHWSISPMYISNMNGRLSEHYSGSQAAFGKITFRVKGDYRKARTSFLK